MSLLVPKERLNYQNKHNSANGSRDWYSVWLMAGSVKDYPTPAPNAELIRKPQLAGRHLIILNNNGRSQSYHSNGRFGLRFQPVVATPSLYT